MTSINTYAIRCALVVMTCAWLAGCDKPATPGVAVVPVLPPASVPVSMPVVTPASAASVVTALASAPMEIAAASAIATSSSPQNTEPEVKECEENWPGCPCPKDLSPILSELNMTPPKGMSMVEGSCTRWHGSVESGIFTFAGAMTVKGAVVYEAGDMFDILSFDGFRLDEPDNGLNLPQFTPENSCWSAPAEIKVKSYEVIIGGTDQAGTWLRSYEVLKLGKYTKCKSPR
ncbi:MAG TPA: hypothetical protein VFQ99_00565 [Gallionella sp.]|nr:hypothetical protein [Gallionella sp.]